MNIVNFWTIVPGKTQCGKSGATDEGFVFIFRNGKYIYKSLMSREKLANTWLNFLEPLDKFQTLGVTSFTLCVIQRESSTQSLPGLRDFVWRGSCCWSAHPSLHPPDFCFSITDSSLLLLLLQPCFYNLTHWNWILLLQNRFPLGTENVPGLISKWPSSLFL